MLSGFFFPQTKMLPIVCYRAVLALMNFLGIFPQALLRSLPLRPPPKFKGDNLFRYAEGLGFK